MNLAKRSSDSVLKAALLAIVFVPFVANAESGFYVGAGFGGANIDAELGDTGFPGIPSSIDEDDTAYKVFVGYNFDLPSVILSVEAGYVDFGEPDVDLNVGELVIDPTGIHLWGIAALEAGPVDLFAKLGYISWDVDFDFLDESASDDGNDIGYGLGLAFNAGPVQIRGEYELYDLDDADASMASLSLIYQF